MNKQARDQELQREDAELSDAQPHLIDELPQLVEQPTAVQHERARTVVIIALQVGGVVFAVTVALFIGRLSAAPAVDDTPSEPSPTPEPESSEVLFDGTACERSGTCRGLDSGLAGFHLDHEQCPSTRQVLQDLRAHQLNKRVERVVLDFDGMEASCYADFHGTSACSIRCHLGINQRHARRFSLGEVRERERRLVTWLRDTYGREQGQFSREMPRGLGRQSNWTWRVGNTSLLVEHRDMPGDDDEIRATAPGSHTQLTVRYSTAGPSVP